MRTSTLRILGGGEDNELNVALLKELLSQRGYRPQFVGDGRAASRVGRGAPVRNLMLLDLHMPLMDGFEVVRAIRAHEETTSGHLPIIALTARSSKRDRERCLAAGMDDFLSKPRSRPPRCGPPSIASFWHSRREARESRASLQSSRDPPRVWRSGRSLREALRGIPREPS